MSFANALQVGDAISFYSHEGFLCSLRDSALSYDTAGKDKELDAAVKEKDNDDRIIHVSDPDSVYELGCTVRSFTENVKANTRQPPNFGRCIFTILALSDLETLRQANSPEDIIYAEDGLVRFGSCVQIGHADSDGILTVDVSGEAHGGLSHHCDKNMVGAQRLVIRMREKVPTLSPTQPTSSSTITDNLSGLSMVEKGDDAHASVAGGDLETADWLNSWFVVNTSGGSSSNLNGRSVRSGDTVVFESLPWGPHRGIRIMKMVPQLQSAVVQQGGVSKFLKQATKSGLLAGSTANLHSKPTEAGFSDANGSGAKLQRGRSGSQMLQKNDGNDLSVCVNDDPTQWNLFLFRKGIANEESVPVHLKHRRLMGSQVFRLKHIISNLYLSLSKFNIADVDLLKHPSRRREKSVQFDPRKEGVHKIEEKEEEEEESDDEEDYDNNAEEEGSTSQEEKSGTLEPRSPTGLEESELSYILEDSTVFEEPRTFTSGSPNAGDFARAVEEPPAGSRWPPMQSVATSARQTTPHVGFSVPGSTRPGTSSGESRHSHDATQTQNGAENRETSTNTTGTDALVDLEAHLMMEEFSRAKDAVSIPGVDGASAPGEESKSGAAPGSARRTKTPHARRGKVQVDHLTLNSLWRVETESIEFGGKHVCWGQRVRFQHVASLRYLTVETTPAVEEALAKGESVAALLGVDSLDVAVTGDASDENTWFYPLPRLHAESGVPEFLRSVPIVFEDGIRLQHVRTQGFLRIRRETLLAELEEDFSRSMSGSMRSARGSSYRTPLEISFLRKAGDLFSPLDVPESESLNAFLMRRRAAVLLEGFRRSLRYLIGVKRMMMQMDISVAGVEAWARSSANFSSADIAMELEGSCDMPFTEHILQELVESSEAQFDSGSLGSSRRSASRSSKLPRSKSGASDEAIPSSFMEKPPIPYRLLYPLLLALDEVILRTLKSRNQATQQNWSSNGNLPLHAIDPLTVDGLVDHVFCGALNDISILDICLSGWRLVHTLWSSVYANDLSPEAKDKLLNHPDHLAVLHLGKRVHKLITLAARGNRRIQLDIVRSPRHFHQVITTLSSSTNLGAVSMFIALFENNEVCIHRLPISLFLEAMVALLRRTDHDSAIWDPLLVTCSVNGVGLPANQMAIANAIFDRYRSLMMLKSVVNVRGELLIEDPTDVYDEKLQKAKRNSLLVGSHESAPVASEERREKPRERRLVSFSQLSQRHQDYYERLLDVYRCLCVGSSAELRERVVVETGIDAKHITQCLLQHSLPYKLKAAYCRLASTMLFPTVGETPRIPRVHILSQESRDMASVARSQADLFSNGSSPSNDNKMSKRSSSAKAQKYSPWKRGNGAVSPAPMLTVDVPSTPSASPLLSTPPTHPMRLSVTPGHNMTAGATEYDIMLSEGNDGGSSRDGAHTSCDTRTQSGSSAEIESQQQSLFQFVCRTFTFVDLSERDDPESAGRLVASAILLARKLIEAGLAKSESRLMEFFVSTWGLMVNLMKTQEMVKVMSRTIPASKTTAEFNVEELYEDDSQPSRGTNRTDSMKDLLQAANVEAITSKRLAKHSTAQPTGADGAAAASPMKITKQKSRRMDEELRQGSYRAKENGRLFNALMNQGIVDMNISAAAATPIRKREGRRKYSLTGREASFTSNVEALELTTPISKQGPQGNASGPAFSRAQCFNLLEATLSLLSQLMQVSVGKRLKFVVEAFNRKRVMAQHTGLKAKDDMGWDIDLLNADDLQKYEERIFSEYITISDNMLTEYEKISLELSLSKKGMAQLQAMLLQLVQVRDFSLQKSAYTMLMWLLSPKRCLWTSSREVMVLDMDGQQKLGPGEVSMKETVRQIMIQKKELSEYLQRSSGMNEAEEFSENVQSILDALNKILLRALIRYKEAKAQAKLRMRLNIDPTLNPTDMRRANFAGHGQDDSCEDLLRREAEGSDDEDDDEEDEGGVEEDGGDGAPTQKVFQNFQERKTQKRRKNDTLRSPLAMSLHNVLLVQRLFVHFEIDKEIVRVLQKPIFRVCGEKGKHVLEQAHEILQNLCLYNPENQERLFHAHADALFGLVAGHNALDLHLVSRTLTVLIRRNREVCLKVGMPRHRRVVHGIRTVLNRLSMRMYSHRKVGQTPLITVSRGESVVGGLLDGGASTEVHLSKGKKDWGGDASPVIPRDESCFDVIVLLGASLYAGGLFIHQQQRTVINQLLDLRKPIAEFILSYSLQSNEGKGATAAKKTGGFFVQAALTNAGAFVKPLTRTLMGADHFALLTLLRACVKGRNHVSEVLGRSLLTQSDLSDVIVSAPHCLIRSAALGFLYDAYLCTSSVCRPTVVLHPSMITVLHTLAMDFRKARDTLCRGKHTRRRYQIISRDTLYNTVGIDVLRNKSVSVNRVMDYDPPMGIIEVQSPQSFSMGSFLYNVANGALNEEYDTDLEVYLFDVAAPFVLHFYDAYVPVAVSSIPPSSVAVQGHLEQLLAMENAVLDLVEFFFGLIEVRHPRRRTSQAGTEFPSQAGENPMKADDVAAKLYVPSQYSHRAKVLSRLLNTFGKVKGALGSRLSSLSLDEDRERENLRLYQIFLGASLISESRKLAIRTLTEGGRTADERSDEIFDAYSILVGSSTSSFNANVGNKLDETVDDGRSRAAPAKRSLLNNSLTVGTLPQRRDGLAPRHRARSSLALHSSSVFPRQCFLQFMHRFSKRIGAFEENTFVADLFSDGNNNHSLRQILRMLNKSLKPGHYTWPSEEDRIDALSLDISKVDAEIPIFEAMSIAKSFLPMLIRLLKKPEHYALGEEVDVETEEQARITSLGGARMLCVLVASLEEFEGVSDARQGESLGRFVEGNMSTLCLDYAVSLLTGGNEDAQHEIHTTMNSNSLVCQKFLFLLRRLLHTAAEERAELHWMRKSGNGSSGVNAASLITDEGVFAYEKRGRPGRTGSGDNEASSSSVGSKAWKVRDGSYGRNTLRFLQLLCEGHFYPLQTLLRYQERESAHLQCNLVGETVSFLHRLVWVQSPKHEGRVWVLDQHNYEVVMQSMTTIIEFAEGCKENQRSLAEGKLLSIINDILLFTSEPYVTQSFENEKVQKRKKEMGRKRRLSISKSTNPYDLVPDPGGESANLSDKDRTSIRCLCIKLLLSLIEGHNGKDNVPSLIDSLDFEVLRLNLEVVLQRVRKLSTTSTSSTSSSKPNTTRSAPIETSMRRDSGRKEEVRFGGRELPVRVGEIVGEYWDMERWKRFSRLSMNDLQQVILEEGLLIHILTSALGEAGDEGGGGKSRGRGGPEEPSEGHAADRSKGLKDAPFPWIIQGENFIINSDKNAFEIFDEAIAPERVISVEILREGNLERLRFIRPELCVQQWKHVQAEKENVLYSVNRDNSSDSLGHFVELSEKIISLMMDKDRLMRYPIQHFIMRNTRIWNTLALFMTFLLNILVVIYCSKPLLPSLFWSNSSGYNDSGVPSLAKSSGDDVELTAKERQDWFDAAVDGGYGGFVETMPDHSSSFTCSGGTTVSAGALVYSLLCILKVVYFLIGHLPSIYRHANKVSCLAEERRAVRGSDRGEVEAKADGAEKDFRGLSRFDKTAVKMHPKIAKSLIMLKMLFVSPAGFPAWTSFFLGISALLFSWIRPILYSILLIFEVIRGNTLMKYVLNAVVSSRGALGQTGLLAIMIIYFFTTVGFLYFADEYIDLGAEFGCDSMLSCIAIHLNFGLRSNGGIGDVLTDAETVFPRILFEDTYWVVITLLSVAVFTGIIIDTFGEMRERKKFIDQDMVSRCFVCGIGASRFQRHSLGFHRHTRQEHNMWGYLFLFTHLRLKDEVDFTSQESYVAEALQKQDFGFFPVGRSMGLENATGRRADDGED